jgi:hypothetical protein
MIHLNRPTPHILKRADIAKIYKIPPTKMEWLCSKNECQNKLEHLQWTEQGKETDCKRWWDEVEVDLNTKVVRKVKNVLPYKDIY